MKNPVEALLNTYGLSFRLLTELYSFLSGVAYNDQLLMKSFRLLTELYSFLCDNQEFDLRVQNYTFIVSVSLRSYIHSYSVVFIQYEVVVVFGFRLLTELYSFL